jgi:hypothetical protein
MRHLSLLFVMLSVLACTSDPNASCPTGGCADDSAPCPDGSPGPDCDDPPQPCPDGSPGPDCDPGCEDGELFPCTCDDGSEGLLACGETLCVCAPQPCTLVHPAELDFGRVPSGVTGAATLALANQGGTACTVSSIRLEGCEAAFGLDVTAGSVPPGGTLAIPVSYQAEGTVSSTCSLSFDVDDPATGHRTVGLRAVSDPDCLTVGPRALDLGSIEAGCGTHQGEVRIENRCSVPVRLDELTLDAPGDFLLLAAPSPGTDVPAGSSVPIAVGYRPDTAGSAAGELRVGLGGLPPIAIALAGTSEAGVPVTDSFHIDERPKLDVLFVIDNGTGMAGLQERLADNLRPFLSFVQAQAIDFHLGVTTTGLEPGGDCPGGVGGGEDGRLFPVDGAVRFVTPETPDLEARWTANFRVGACREGPNHALEAAVRALTPPVADSADDPRHPEENDGNAGFFRPEAHLSVVAITNRADTSPETPNYYYNALLALKGFRNTHLFNFHALTGDRANGCERDDITAAPGDRLIDVVEKTAGGEFQSICEPDWSDFLRDWWPATAAVWPQSCMYLTAEPKDLTGDGEIREADGEVAVRIDGTPVHEIGPQGQRIWDYDADRVAVCFGPLAVPEPGSTIEIDYTPVCGW